MNSKPNKQHRKISKSKSGIDGTGLFAKKYIKKGETVALIKGPILNCIVVDKKTSSAGPNWIGIGKNKWVNPNMYFDHINHSCDPNAGIKGSKTVVALGGIKMNEEITIDYSITEEDTLWRLHKKCQCGSKKYRKIIRSIQFLPERVFNSYLPYIPKYFQRAYIRYHKDKKWKINQKILYGEISEASMYVNPVAVNINQIVF